MAPERTHTMKKTTVFLSATRFKLDMRVIFNLKEFWSLLIGFVVHESVIQIQQGRCVVDQTTAVLDGVPSEGEETLAKLHSHLLQLSRSCL